MRASTNGSTWTTQTPNFSTTTFGSIAYGNGAWIAGGGGGQIRTSTNGSTWTTQTSNFGTTGIQSIAYGNGLWVAGGNIGQIRTSTNSAMYRNNSKIFSWNNTFIIINNSSNTVTQSIDALTTNSFTVPGSVPGLNHYITNRTTNVLLGNSGRIYTNTLPSTSWTEVNTGINDNFVNGAIQIDYTRPDTTNTAVNWTTVTSNFDITNVSTIAYGNGLWVAGGYTGTIRTSTNGSTWTTVTSNFGTSQIFSVAYANGLWIAGGSYGQMRTSANGSTWTTVTSNFGTTNILSIAYANGLWIAGGSYGQMRTSANGSTWTTITSNFGLQSILSIAYANGLWIAGGYQGQMRTSPQLYNYNYNITGNNASYYSTNLTTWTTVAFPAASTINDIIAKS